MPPVNLPDDCERILQEAELTPVTEGADFRALYWRQTDNLVVANKTIAAARACATHQRLLYEGAR